MTTLVSYTSRHGATDGIAERIAARIADSRESVDLSHVDAVRTLTGTRRLSSVRRFMTSPGRPRPTDSSRRTATPSPGRPLWLSSVGSFGDTKRLIGPLTHQGADEHRNGAHRPSPRDYRVFQGVIRKQQWPFWSRVLYHAFGGRT